MLGKAQGGAVARSSQLRATPARSAPTVPPPTGPPTGSDEAPLIHYDLEELQLPCDGGADPRQKEAAVIEAFEASLEKHRLSQQGRAHRKRARDTTAIKLTLVNAVAASLIGGPDFYNRLNPTRQRLVELCDSLLATDPEFVLKVAVYTRQHLNIRSTANFLLAIAANRRRCRKYLRKYFGDSVRLPSDWIEVAQLSQTFYNGSINYGSLPSALRKAMVAKFTDFDEYQLAKYNKEGKRKDGRTVSAHEAKAKGEAALANGGEAASSGGGGADDDRYTRTTSSRSEDELELEKLTFSLKQLIRKLHVREPSHLVMAVLGKHYPESLQAFQRARLEGEWDPDRAGERMKLAVPKTWETQVSLYGNTAAVWEELIASHKLPYMAMLRNIRNLIKAGVSDKVHDEVLSRLPNPRAVANSRQFPFRYFSAYEAIGEVEQESQGKRGTAGHLVRRYRKALDEAVIQATRLNVTPIPGTTVVFVDVSDSLRVPCTSARGLGKPREVLEVGILLGLMCKYAAEQCYLVLFSDVAAPQLLTVVEGTILENMESVLQTVEEMRAPYLSWGDMATASPRSTFHLATRSSSAPGDGAESTSDTCEVLLHNVFVKLQREGKTEDRGSGSSASSNAGFPLAAIEVLLENNVVLKNALILGGSDTLPPGLAHLLVR
jgi:telomerase protein component 1